MHNVAEMTLNARLLVMLLRIVHTTKAASAENANTRLLNLFVIFNAASNNMIHALILNIVIREKALSFTFDKA